MPDHNGVKKNRLKRHNKTSSSSKSNSFDSNNSTINSELFTTSTSNITSTSSSITNNEQVVKRVLRVLIFTESFHPYTSGIARRFKEIIERLAKRGFLIHVVTGCKVNSFDKETLMQMSDEYDLSI